MHICFVAEGYPTPEDPFMPFVRELVVRIAELGVKCSVVVPQSITRAKRHNLSLRPQKWYDYVDEKTVVEVYQPYYITVSNLVKKFNDLSFIFAAKCAYKKIKTPVDVLYAHFWRAGILASAMVKDLPIVVASGESRIQVRKLYKEKVIEKFLTRVKGVIYVSKKNYEESIELRLQNDIPYIIAPNGYDSKVFYKLDRNDARRKLGYSVEDVIGCFVGAFTERKGVQRVQAAAKKIKGLKMIYIGRGEQAVEGDNILFCGSVPHDKISVYLSCSDFFVLPTTAEGCCNAIVEALACQLPVISSDLSFNDDLLNNNNSIRIDPLDVNAIYEAMNELVSSQEKRKAMSSAAKKVAEDLKIENRAATILKFICSVK